MKPQTASLIAYGLGLLRSVQKRVLDTLSFVLRLIAVGVLSGAGNVMATIPPSNAGYKTESAAREAVGADAKATLVPLTQSPGLLDRALAYVAGVGRLQGLVFKAAGNAVSGMPNDGAARQFEAGRILVVKDPASADVDFEQTLLAQGGRSLGRLQGLDAHVVEVTPGSEQAVIARLTGKPNVRFVEFDQLAMPAATANDPYLGNQWHLGKISAPTAWDSSTGVGVTIAILDSGVDGSHPDLAARMVSGWNFYDNNNNTADVRGHGTAVAGIAAAASNNGVGVAGVAPNASIMPIRVSDSAGRARWSAIASGLIWAADHGARVANISYEGTGSSRTMEAAVNYFRSKGGVVVTAAGNTGTVDTTILTDVMVVVSATDNQDKIATWSSRGSFLDISAPGADIYSTAKGGGYSSWSGTSMSASIVSGTAALMLSLRPDLTPAQVESALVSSATDLGAAGFDTDYGYGRVNAAAAVQAIAPVTPPPPPPTGTCTRAAPGIAMTPLQSAGVAAGTTVPFSITVTNNDTAGCNASGFDVNTTIPAGWNANTLASLFVSPGASISTTLQVTSPVGTTNGSNPIVAVAVNQMASTFARSATATYLVANPAATAPGAPTIGTATAGNAQATVNFTAPASNGGSAITSYTVTSSPGNLTVTGAASPLTVTGLTNGTAYTFTVKATNTIGTGAASAASNSVTPTAPATVPGAPTIGTATAGNAQATVNFAAPTSNGGSAITSYTVISSPGNLTVTGAASPLTVTGLTNGTAYTFTVKATNAVGTGAASAASNSVTPATTATVPAAPTIGTATAGNAQATVSFTAPASNGGSAITSYTVTSAPGGKIATGAASPLTVTGLTNGTAYTFTVKATNTVGTGAASAASNSVTPTAPATVPGAPTIGTATAGNAQATVNFTAPASNGGSAITSYTVTSSPGNFTVTGAASPLTVTGLTNGTAYTFTAKATNAVGTGVASAASNSVTPAAVASNILWSANHEGGNFSEWSGDGGGMAQGFFNYAADTTGTVKVEVSSAQAQSGSKSARLEMPNGTGNQAQLIRWKESETNADLYYSVWLYFPQAIDTSAGWLNLLQIHTHGGGGWTIPIGIEVRTQANGANTFFLHSPYSTTSAWNTGGMPYWEYSSTQPIPIGRWFNVELRFKRDASAGAVQFWQEGVQVFNVQNVQTTHTGATYHEFYVNLYGQGLLPSPTVAYVDNVAISAARIGAAATTTVPGAPTIGTATAGNAQATVNFTAPASNGGSAITSYTVTSSPGNLTATGAASPLTVTGLTNGTAYTFTVKATNAVGVGAASAASNAVTPTAAATVPSAPTIGTATAGNAQATVSFAAPASNGGSAITSYTVTSSPGNLTATGAASPLAVTGLTNGTAYTFTVKATNTVGTGTASAASNSVTPTAPATVPGAPTIGTATAGNAQATVNFTAPASNGGSAITSYTVTSSPGNLTATGAASPLTVAGLTNGTAYTFTVKATNTVGSGVASAASNSVTPAAPVATAPGAPTIGAATAGNAQATVNFAAPASNGGSAITSYTVTASPGGQTATGIASPLSVAGLTNGTAYTFTVTAANAVGTSASSAASNSVTPTAVVLSSSCSATTGPLTLNASSSRPSGVAPLAVVFNASGSTHTGLTSYATQPFHEIQYTWTFGDAAGDSKGNTAWAYGTRTAAGSKNIAYGPVAAHVFDPAAGSGTSAYTVNVSAFDGTNTATCSIQVTVDDPNTVFSGTKTTCVSATSLPVAGAGGCPVGSAVAQQSSWPTIVGSYLGTGKRILLKGNGDVYTGASNTSLAVTGPAMIGMYGTGAKPIIQTTSTSGSIGYLTGTISDLRLVDLNIDGQNKSSTNAMASGAVRASKVLWYRVDIHNIGCGIDLEETQAASAPDSLAFVESTIKTLNSSGGSNCAIGLRFASSNVAVMGNLFSDSTGGSAEHLARFHWLDKAVISNNMIEKGHTAAPGNKEMLSIRAIDSAAGKWGMTGDAVATKYVLVSENQINVNTYAGIQTVFSGDGSDRDLWRDILIEKNYIPIMAGGGDAMRLLGSRITVRNNLMDVTSSSEPIGIMLDRAYTSIPAPSNIAIYNNTIYSGGSTGGFAGVMLSGGSSGVTVKNNLVYAPNEVGPVVVMNQGSTSPTIVNNTAEGTGAGSVKTSPMFSVSPPTAPAHYKPTCTATTYPCSKGTTVPVWYDFMGALPATRDMGAMTH